MKIDTTENWNKATNFYPFKGEIILYSDVKKFKVGDGDHIPKDLPFYAEYESINTGDGNESIIFGEGSATGDYAIAGGTTDSSLVKEITGIEIESIPDSSIEAELGEGGLRLKENLLANPEPRASGAASLSFGTGTNSITAMSVTTGAGTEAGSKGFYIHRIHIPEDGGNITIDLSTTKKPYYKYQIKEGLVFGDLVWREGNKNTRSWTSEAGNLIKNKWAVGDRVNVTLMKIHCLNESIVAIDDVNGILTITNSGDITASEVAAATEFKGATGLAEAEIKLAVLATYQFTVAVPAKPDVGIAEIHFAAVSSGLGSIAAGTLSEAHGSMNLAAGQFSYVVGQNNKTGYGAFASGQDNEALGYNTHVSGNNNSAIGSGSSAEGYKTTAYGENSHIEGNSVKKFNEDGAVTKLTTNNIYQDWKDKDAYTKYSLAYGDYSHVEGQNNIALGSRAHAEGWMTAAKGWSSHSEGKNTEALGENSHVEGLGTIANSPEQHVQGRYNTIDNNGIYAHIIGNGTSTKRANIHTIDWDGNARFSGNLKHNGVYHLGPYNDFANGYLIDIGSSTSNIKVTLKVTGNGYGTQNNPNLPINSIFQFRNYNENDKQYIVRPSGMTLGADIGNLNVYNLNGRLYAHLERKSSDRVYYFEILSDKTSLSPKVTDEAAAASGTAIIPKVVATKADIDNLINNSTEALDTLTELAAALNDDKNFASTVTNNLAQKADKTHTHNSLNVGNIGSDANPVYFKDGKPVQSIYDLAEHDLILDRLRTVEGDVVVYDNAIENQPLDIISYIGANNLNLVESTARISPDDSGKCSNDLGVFAANTYTIYYEAFESDPDGISTRPINLDIVSGNNIFNSTCGKPMTFVHTGGSIKLCSNYQAWCSTLKLEIGTEYTGVCDSNVRFSSIKLTQSGKNLLNPSAVLAASKSTSLNYDIFTTHFSDASLYLNCTWMDPKSYPSGTYTITFIPVTEGACVSVYIYAKDDNTELTKKIDIGTNDVTSLSFTADREFVVAIGGASSDQYRGTHSFKLQLEVGDSKTDYEPFREERTFTREFSSEVIMGYISAGTFNWSTGELIDFDGTTYQLDPQEIPALAGTNCLYSSTGKTAVKQDCVKIDKTLTKNNAAADAKATGDKIKTLQSWVDAHKIGTTNNVIHNKGTYSLGTHNDYSKGYLIEVGPMADNIKGVLNIIANGYGLETENLPIMAVVQFYDYNSNGTSAIARFGGVCTGGVLENIRIYRHTPSGKLYIHVPNKTGRMFSFELSTNRTDLTPKVTNASYHTSNLGSTKTITLQQTATQKYVDNKITNAIRYGTTEPQDDDGAPDGSIYIMYEE